MKIHPPRPEEIEVSLFGPGYGESVLLHVGSNNWIIVDSCIDRISKAPLPLAYLSEIGVDPAKNVKLLIATHWHDDHIRGLSLILKECASTEFVCSAAMGSREFETLVSAYRRRSMMVSTGVKEFLEILNILEERGNKRPPNYPRLAIADRLLWCSKPSPGETGYSCEIHSLSPSDPSVIKSKIEIDNLIPVSGETKRRVPVIGPNHAAVVLLVRIGDDQILLGSDLEELGDAGRGWSAIISSQTRPQGKASFFKIPHHGSANADHPEIWLKLLEPEPLSVLTPFSVGNVVLPTRGDATRICNNTTKAFSTGVPGYKITKGRDPMVEKQLREMGQKIRQVPFQMGQVRARGSQVNGKITWRVELLRGALPLSEVHR
ncbi:MAG: MBL fold metallo-hydrolase [Desulfobaccales bacterium]